MNLHGVAGCIIKKHHFPRGSKDGKGIYVTCVYNRLLVSNEFSFGGFNLSVCQSAMGCQFISLSSVCHQSVIIVQVNVRWHGKVS